MQPVRGAPYGCMELDFAMQTKLASDTIEMICRTSPFITTPTAWTDICP